MLPNVCTQVLASGMRTKDIACAGETSSGTQAVGDAIVAKVEELLQAPRPMTLSEKILCHNAIGLKKAEVNPGDMISVKVQLIDEQALLMYCSGAMDHCFRDHMEGHGKDVR